ncbi:MAG: SPOR domain-containing protein [Acidobacteriota bacterium]
MRSRLFLFSAALLISTCPAIAFADSDPAVPYTLQVAAFPSTDLADILVAKLVQAGEHPVCTTVELQGRGYWTRVFVGLFSTGTAARRYGDNLIARGIVNEFLVRRAEPDQAVTRLRRVTAGDSHALGSAAKPVAPYALERNSEGANDLASRAKSVGNATVKAEPVGATRDMRTSAGRPLIDFRAAALELAPVVDTGLIPRPDPVTLALRLVVGERRSGPLAIQDRGGLWITGDTAEGLVRLRWIVGDENAELIKIDHEGRVQLDRRLLAKTAGLRAPRVEDPLHVVDFISSNEGLLLLVQVAEGRYRYRLHVGRQVPTRGKSLDVAGSINLDKNFDSRINPYRKDGKKLDTEQPPEGFDSLVALNPVARWFNLRANYWVQAGAILFHELAEAYAKLDLGLDYLEQGSEPGAHALALDRERRLKSQRPGADIVLTAGSNRVLRTQEEIRLFYAEGATGFSQR